MKTKANYKDGDVIDVSQTINGCSKFIVHKKDDVLSVEYYDTNRPYEYDVLSLLNIKRDNDLYDADDDIKLLGNIYDKTNEEIQMLREIVMSWESLSEGNYTVSTINEWLLNKMKPSIDKARKLVKKI